MHGSMHERMMQMRQGGQQGMHGGMPHERKLINSS
jgi:hypothetical protein